MLFNLSNQDVKNINIFLNRVDLKGSESVSLVMILQALKKPLTVDDVNNLLKQGGKKIIEPEKIEAKKKEEDEPAKDEKAPENEEAKPEPAEEAQK